MAVGHIWKVRLNAFFSPSALQNVRYYLVTAEAGAGPSPAQVAAAILPVVLPQYKAMTSDRVRFDSWSCQRLSGAGIPLTDDVSDTTGMGVFGDLVDDALPSVLAGVLSLRTATPGKSYRGRLFLFPSTELANLATGRPTIGYIAQMTALGVALATTLAAGGGPNTATLVPAVFSRTLSVATPVTTVLSRDEWGTMRSRKPYRGI